jgi:hypothetical protein
MASFLQEEFGKGWKLSAPVISRKSKHCFQLRGVGEVEDNEVTD